MKTFRFSLLFSILVISLAFYSGCAPTTQVIVEKVEIEPSIAPVPAGKFDTGRMWTFDYPPMEYFNETYNFEPTSEWFEKARLAALRLPGCSASFVSASGLVMTNHHCVIGYFSRIEEEGERILDNGFYAATLEEERQVPGTFVDQLILVEDVTERIQTAFGKGVTDEEKIQLRREEIEAIKEECVDETGLNCDVITFFNGGRYSLYGYKRYTDVRMVYVPEASIGFFGGDPDNFTYPRYNLDVSFLRVYDEDGQPYRPEHYFQWSSGGAEEGDAVFVIGNPGRTNRLLTFSQLEFSRDKTYPLTLNLIDNMVSILQEYVEKFPEKKPQYETRLFGLENTQKAFRGRIAGLHDPDLMGRKLYFEQKFIDEVNQRENLRVEYSHLWNEIAQIQEEKRAIFNELRGLAIHPIARATLISIGGNVVQYAQLLEAPEEDRDQERLQSLEQQILGANVEIELEREMLRYNLQLKEKLLGKDYPALQTLLRGKPAAEAAENLLNTTALLDSTTRAQILGLSPQDILNYPDPIIQYIKDTDNRYNELNRQYNEYTTRESARVEFLGRALYEIYGTSIPPDATFTLRLADGVVKGYEYNGTIAPPVTTFYGLYDRYYSHGKVDPWYVPDQWKYPPAEFRKSTPINFVSTTDVIGGNSGSPVVNINLEVVGLVFDGNIESLPGDFIFAEEQNRTVSVHSEGILEALRYMYNAKRIVRELESGKIITIKD